MNANLKYEIKAEAFRRLTGMLAPGKDQAACDVSVETYETRVRAWELWQKLNGDCIYAMLAAFETVCHDPWKCPSCGARKEQVLECCKCGREKCEGCATDLETDTQICAFCRKIMDENGPQRP